MGKGLLHRAIDNKAMIRILLKLIACYQIIVAIILIVVAAMFIYMLHDAGINHLVMLVANIALALFCILWLFFLCGGLRFAYWIKFSAAQTTHFILLILGVLTIILVNM